MSRSYSKPWRLFALPAWVFVSFITAAVIVQLLTDSFPLSGINQVVSDAVAASLLYIISLAIVIGVPWVVFNKRTSKSDVGVDRWPSWGDIFITPVSLISYYILSWLLTLLATVVLPAFDINQAQDVGFNNLFYQYEHILAFLTLVVIAPLAEEILFRGYLYGKLKKTIPVWLAIFITSLMFGYLHGAWNLGIDTFALGIILCLLREYTGSIWASVLLHMAKNGLAFYLLFINPTFLSTLIR